MVDGWVDEEDMLFDQPSDHESEMVVCPLGVEEQILVSYHDGEKEEVKHEMLRLYCHGEE